MTDKILIGKIFGAAGVKGEIKLFHYSGERERIAGIRELFFHQDGVGGEAGKEAGFIRKKVLSMRYAGKTPILLVEGVHTRDEAESLCGAEVYAETDALAPLGDGGYYVDELTGFAVADESGERIGVVSGVLDNPAHDILRISPGRGGGELLLPMVDVFVLAVDTARREIRVRLPDGLDGGAGRDDED
ncbi:MAG: ribosome maturation factor RimM [Clostridiales Family XIII bacterium]|nr:ribosome maturation factor RimM [Clostridiales Family XIII bacterium]